MAFQWRYVVNKQTKKTCRCQSIVGQAKSLAQIALRTDLMQVTLMKGDFLLKQSRLWNARNSTQSEQKMAKKYQKGQKQQTTTSTTISVKMRTAETVTFWLAKRGSYFQSLVQSQSPRPARQVIWITLKSTQRDFDIKMNRGKGNDSNYQIMGLK